MMNDIYFQHPMFLYLLSLVIFIPYLVRKTASSVNCWSKMCDKHLIKFITTTKDKRRENWLVFLSSICFLCLVLAMANPSIKGRDKAQKTYSYIPRIFILDLSPSMLIADVTPNRLALAWFKLNDMIKKADVSNNALVVFSDEPYLITPFTKDYKVIADFTSILSPDIMPEGGSNPARAIKFACDFTELSEYKHSELILITDDVSAHFEETRTATKTAKKRGCRVSIMAVGSKDGDVIFDKNGNNVLDKNNQPIFVGVDFDKLKEITKISGGNFVIANQLSDADISELLKAPWYDYIFAETDDNIKNNNSGISIGKYFLIPIVLLMALSFRRGLIFVLLLLPNNLNAKELKYYFLNPNYIGKQYLLKNNPDKAYQAFTDYQMKAVSAYNNKDYQATIDILVNNSNTSDDYYNLGNSYAFILKFTDAITAYENAIKIEPNNEDAITNKKIIEELLNQNQDNNNQGNKQGQGQTPQSDDRKNNGGDGSDGSGVSQSGNNDKNSPNNNQSMPPENDGNNNRDNKGSGSGSNSNQSSAPPSSSNDKPDQNNNNNTPRTNMGSNNINNSSDKCDKCGGNNSKQDNYIKNAVSKNQQSIIKEKLRMIHSNKRYGDSKEEQWW